MQKLSLRLLTHFNFTVPTRLIIALLAATLFTPSLHANINNIKGTYDILNPKYKQFSVIHGAVAWETGTIRRMYDFGALGAHGKGKIKSKTIDLLYQMFYRKPRTASISEFVVSSNLYLTNPKEKDPKKRVFFAPNMIVSFIATMIGELERAQESELIQRYQQTLIEYKKNMNLVAQRAPKKKQAGEDTPKKSVKSAQVLTQEISLARANLLTELTTHIADLSTYPKYYQELVPSIFSAYLECLVEDYLPAYAPQLILLSFLYKQTECNKILIEQYYELLDKNFACLAGATDWATWEKETFSRKDKKTFLEELEKNPVTDASLDAWYERIAFVSLISEFPPIQGYGNASIKNGEYSTTFADCMDNIFRVFINFLCYNPETKFFDLNLLTERLGVTPHESVQEFYKNFNDPSSVADQKIHSAWAQTVISNIPFVAYNRTLPGDVVSERGAVKGLTQDSKFYMQPQPGAFLYETNPSLKNTIIVLNHLLGLNLFAGPNSDTLAEEFLKEDFVKTYLPKLAEKLKNLLPEDYNFNDIDKNDYTDIELSFPLKFTFEVIDNNHYSFEVTLKTTSAHSEIELTLGEKKQNIFELVTYSSAKPTSLIMLMPLTIGDDKTSKLVAHNLSTLLLQLFSKPINDPDAQRTILAELPLFNENIFKLILFATLNNADPVTRATRIISLSEKMLKHKITPSKADLESILNALELGFQGVLNHQPNTHTQRINIIMTFKTLEEHFSSHKNIIYAKMLETTQPALKEINENMYDRYSLESALKKTHSKLIDSLDVLTILAEKDIYLAEITTAVKTSYKAAKKLTRSKYVSEKGFGEDIFIALVNLLNALAKNNHFFEEAVDIGEQALRIDSSMVRSEAVKFLETLIKNTKTHQKALSAINSLLEDNMLKASAYNEKPSEKEWADDLLKTENFKKPLKTDEDRFSEAIEKVHEDITEWQKREEAIILLKTLFKENRGIEEALKLAQENTSDEKEIRDDSIATAIYVALVESDKAIKEVLDTLKKIMASGIGDKHYIALNVYSALIKKDLAFDEATKTAQEALTSNNKYTKRMALDLYTELVNKGYALLKATEATQKYLSSEEDVVREAAQKLSKAIEEHKVATPILTAPTPAAVTP